MDVYWTRPVTSDDSVRHASPSLKQVRHSRLGHALGFVGAAMILVAVAQQQAEAQLKPAEEGYFTGADNVRLFYRKLGAGHDVVVFLHGGPGADIHDGGYLMDRLARDHVLFMYDQRGGGRSDLISKPEMLTADADVRDLEALRQHFGIEKMSLVGLSWGSGLAALYTAAHPDRAQRIVFLAPMPIANRPFVEERGKKLDSLVSSEDAARATKLEEEMKTASDDKLQSLCRQRDRIAMRPYLVHPEKMEGSSWDTCAVSPAAIRNSPAVFNSVAGSLGDFDFRPMLRQLKVPALVIEGAQTNVPLDSTREWAKAPPDARLDLIPDAGHASFVEQNDAVIQAIENFLGRKWPRGSARIENTK